MTRPRCGRDKRRGWGAEETRLGPPVSWGQRLQESSWQEKETKNNPERESPERGTGKWEGEGEPEQGNSDTSLSSGTGLHVCVRACVYACVFTYTFVHTCFTQIT